MDDVLSEFDHYALMRHKAALGREERHRRSPAYARGQWRVAASESLREGHQFSVLATRQIAVPWDGRSTALEADVNRHIRHRG